MKLIKNNNLHVLFYFSPKLSWGVQTRFKMLPLDPLRFSTIENPILRTFIVGHVLDHVASVLRFFASVVKFRQRAHFTVSQSPQLANHQFPAPQ